jgi:hypothetical protein
MAVTPRPGDFGLVHINGNVGTAIRWVQLLNGDGFADYEHSFIYLGDSKRNVVEAEPKGAALRPFHYDPSKVYWSSGLIDLTGAQRDKIVGAAIGYVGTPYSYLDYVALASKRLHFSWAPWLKNYVASTGHMICSQLVARCYLDAGHPLFDAWTGYVTPGDLWQLLESKKR